MADEKPKTGEQSKRQSLSVGFGVLGFVGNIERPTPGTYKTYRDILCDPTVALCWSIITGPIYAGSWTFEAKDDSVPDERVEFIKNQFEPQRPDILNHGLRAVNLGYSPFEKVWELKEQRLCIAKLKHLLPDLTEIQVDPHGAFAGIKQPKDGIELEPGKCWIHSYDAEAGNLYGKSRLENIRRRVWKAWETADERAAQLSAKAAAIIPQVHYPPGESQDKNGSTTSNFEAAQRLLNHLATGRGVAIPNLFAASDDPKEQAELAGKAQWVISFLEATNAASSLAGMTERQRYLDSLKVRAMLRPERAVIEAQTAGSRADSETASDAGILDSAKIDGDLCRSLSQSAVDDVLVLNFGEEARGSVYVQPAPLADEAKVIFKQLFQQVTANPGLLEEVVMNVDMDAVFDALKLPKANSVITFTPGATQPDKPELTPEQKKQLDDDYRSTPRPAPRQRQAKD